MQIVPRYMYTKNNAKTNKNRKKTTKKPPKTYKKQSKLTEVSNPCLRGK